MSNPLNYLGNFTKKVSLNMYYPILYTNTHKHPFWCSYSLFGCFYPSLCELHRHVIKPLSLNIPIEQFGSPVLPQNFSSPTLSLFLLCSLLSLLSLSLSLSARFSLFSSPSLHPALLFPLSDVPLVLTPSAPCDLSNSG